MADDFFSSVFQASRPFSIPQGETLREIFSSLVNHKIVVETKPAKLAICRHCGTEKPIYRSPGRHTYIICDDDDIEIPSEDLRRWRIDINALQAFLRDALELSDLLVYSPEHEISYLGRRSSPNGGFPIWLMISRADPSRLLVAQHFLKTRSPAERGVVICDHPLGLSTLWSRDSKPVLLDEILNVNAGDILLNSALLMSSAPETKLSKSSPGRPMKSAISPNDLFLERIRSGEASQTSCNAEAKAIAAFEEEQVGNGNARKWTTIRNQIGSDYSDWKSSNFSTSWRPSQNSK